MRFPKSYLEHKTVSVFFHHEVDILVSSTREIHENHLISWKCRSEPHRVGDGMSALDRRDDTLGSCEHPKRLDGFIITYRLILHTTDIMQIRVFWSNSRIVES